MFFCAVVLFSAPVFAGAFYGKVTVLSIGLKQMEIQMGAMRCSIRKGTPGAERIWKSLSTAEAQTRGIKMGISSQILKNCRNALSEGKVK